MRTNLPITQEEYILADGAMLVSKTDLKGHITFANEAFIEASGFSLTELLGKAHNIVRHPDMPEEAFQDLWDTLRAGKPWTAMVKNRRKNGDCYWVLANATPIGEAGAIAGYMSVRSKPTREQVEAAESLYRLFREQRAGTRVIREGRVVRHGVTQRLNFLARASLSVKASCVSLLIAAPAAALMALSLLPIGEGRLRTAIVSTAFFLGTLGLAAWAHWIRRLAATLRMSSAHIEELTQGRFERIFEAHGEDELAALQRSLQSLRTKVGFELADSRRLAIECARIRQALDVAAANVMVADQSHDIIYANRSLMRMLESAQADIRLSLPSFNAAGVLGTNIDQFHARPAHQRDMLARITGTHQTRLRLGGRTIDLLVTPVHDTDDRRVGTVVEWNDRTQELALSAKAEALHEQEIATVRQIDTIVAAAIEGDLSGRVEAEGMTGFFASVAAGLNALLENMAGLVSSVKAAAAEVRGGADEIARGNMDLSSRTEEQASALEETASSMEQMASSAHLSSGNAAQADQLASEARAQAEAGGGIVAETVVAMQGISASSDRIASIIGVIDAIAFQTNLLALNAAVEAARAGEQGRGFAVVASEVRNLASRSAAAAREIKTLIEDSSNKVAHGTNLVGRSGKALEDIVRAVTKVTSVVAEMSGASKEQAAGIEQVNKAVMSLDAVTQQNAALVEQAAAAAESLLEQAGRLDVIMAKYVLGEGSRAPMDSRVDKQDDQAPTRRRAA